MICYLQADHNGAFSVCHRSESPGSRLSCGSELRGKFSTSTPMGSGEKQDWMGQAGGGGARMNQVAVSDNNGYGSEIYNTNVGQSEMGYGEL